MLLKSVEWSAADDLQSMFDCLLIACFSFVFRQQAHEGHFVGHECSIGLAFYGECSSNNVCTWCEVCILLQCARFFRATVICLSALCRAVRNVAFSAPGTGPCKDLMPRLRVESVRLLTAAGVDRGLELH